MNAEAIKNFLNEDRIIDKQKVLDRAYEVLPDTMDTDKINRRVEKIINKSKTEKEALERVEKLAEKHKKTEVEESTSFLNHKEKINMKFKELVDHYLNPDDYKYRSTKNQVNINEMALKHLEGTQELWDAGDLEGVAEKYIENATKDNKDYTNILRGLRLTFGSKRFEKNREEADQVSDLIRKRVRGLQAEAKAAAAGNVNEMALRHLEGTQELWDSGDLEGVADKYIENATKDNKNYTNILRGLKVTFNSKTLDHNREAANEVSDIVRKKVRAMQEKEKAAANAPKPKVQLIKKSQLED